MGMGLAQAYGADNVSQRLRQRIMDKMVQQQQQHRMGIDDQAMALRQQEAQQRAEEFKMQQEDRRNLAAERAQAGAVLSAGRLAPTLPMDQNVAPEAADIMRAGGMGGQLYTPPTMGQTESGEPFVPELENHAMNLGTAPQQEVAAKKAYIRGILAKLPANSPGRMALEYNEATGDNPPAGLFDKPAKPNQPIMRVNPRTGKVEQIGQAPPDSHIVNEPAPAGSTDRLTYGAPQTVVVGGKRVIVRPGSDGRLYDQTGQPVAGAEPDAPARSVTGAERQVLAFYNRGKEAIDTLTTPDAQGTSLEQRMASQALPNQLRLGYGGPGSNLIQSSEQQAYRQAQRAFTEARLRKESGAAIPPAEYDNDARTYFAQPGDTPSTIEQKRRARQTVLDGLKFASGQAYTDFYGEPNVSPARADGATPPSSGPGPKRTRYDMNGNMVP